MQDDSYDVIIVGLGCVGLSSAYHLSRKGLKVLGLEKYSHSGALGTSSSGHCRIFRYMHECDRYYDMQVESIRIF